VSNVNRYAMPVEKAEELGCGAVRTAHLLRMNIVYHVRR
jgi:hypothetical protein